MCENIVWKALSINTVNNGRRIEGALIALMSSLLSRHNKLRLFAEAFFRTDLPNIYNIVATAFMFVLIIYLHGFRVELPVKSVYNAREVSSLPIKLFYTSNTPIILQSTILNFIFFLSKALARTFPGNFLVYLLGVWDDSYPVSGLCSYLIPPASLATMVLEPIHTIVYIAFMLGSCAYLSSNWIERSGLTARDVANKMKSEQKVLRGFRVESVEKHLNRYIPTAAAVGGLCIGALSVLSELIGALGSGTGIFLAVTTIHQYYEIFLNEQRANFGKLYF